MKNKGRIKPAKRYSFADIIGIIALADFILAWVIVITLGGNGWFGYVKEGHYYLGSHGHYTETSGVIWYFTKYQVVSVFILMLFASIVKLIRKVHRNFS